MSIAPGIHTLTNEEYHAAPGISKTGLWTIYTKTPAHFRFGERKSKPFFDLGSAAHAAILQPEIFEAEFVEGPDDRRGNKWKDALLAAENAGVTLLTSGDYAKALRIRDAAEKSETLRSIRSGLEVEQSGFAVEPETGVLCRCRPDGYNRDMRLIADLKTTTEGGRDEFSRSTANYGYHVQEAFYEDVWNMAMLHEEIAAADGSAHDGRPAVEAFMFVVIETSAPFFVSCYELDPNAVAEGRAIYRKALARYAECAERERLGMPPERAWPGYPDNPEPLDIPKWAYRLTEPEHM